MTQQYLGSIMLFAGNFAIRNFATCDGQTLSIAQNAALFSLLGTTYGGNGVTTFQLPDLRGRVPLNFGQGPGLSNYNLGQTGGSEAVTLNQQSVPSHLHALSATSANTTTVTPGPTVLTGSLNASDGQFYPVPTNIGFTATNMNATAVTSQGSGQSHNNIQPTLAITYLIALQGIFPSRN
ncbi:MAG TPA: tail fiber protein [Caulobacteraceae bacterium]|nr:tail fiber protein [Caulobacteraceae bacterium]